jgi:hypothetical protein
MMGLPGDNVPDAIRAGLGLAARAAGAWCDAYRPSGTGAPLDSARRFMRLPAIFTPADGAQHLVRFGQALWQGVFDGASMRPGDYIVSDEGTFFIISQPRLGPIGCVRCNRVLSAARTGTPPFAGLNRYSGVQAHTLLPLFRQWPASVLALARDGGRGALPSDAPGGSGGGGGWEVLLPAVDGVLLRQGDVLTDDIGRTAIVASAELSALGWRLLARQATS